MGRAHEPSTLMEGLSLFMASGGERDYFKGRLTTFPEMAWCAGIFGQIELSGQFKKKKSRSLGGSGKVGWSGWSQGEEWENHMIKLQCVMFLKN